MSKVEITSKEELKKWLQDKPGEWSAVIALRSALRVSPFVSDPVQDGTEPASQLTLPIYRAMAISSGAAKIPPDDMERRTAATTATATATAATAATATTATAAAAFAATAAATTATAAAAYAATAAATAADADADANANAAYAAAFADADANAAADSAFAAAFADIWRALSSDYQKLSQGQAPTDLLASPLWEGEPEWYRDSAQRADIWLRDNRAGFEIWSKWYDRVRTGKAHAFDRFDQDADQAFYKGLIDQDNDWWERDAAIVNAEIAGWVEDLRGLPPPPLPIDQIKEILEKTASPEVRVEDGKISVGANDRFETPTGGNRKELTEHLIDLAALLSNGLSDNAPPALSPSLSTYAEVLNRNRQKPALQTLETVVSVVRTLHAEEGHESWANGLQSAFADFLKSHAELSGEYPKQSEQKAERAKLQPNQDRMAEGSLSDDVNKFKEIAEQLRELGVTEETAQDFFDSMIAVGMDIAYGGQALQDSDSAITGVPADWSPATTHRANLTGLSIQLEARLGLLLTATGHSSFPAVITSLTDFTAYMLRYFA